MTGDEGKQVTGSLQYCAINKSPSGKASMTSQEGKQVTGSAQYCAVKQSPYGKASMTGDEGKQVKGSVQYCAVNQSPCGKVSVTGQGGKQVTGLVQCYGVERIHEGKPNVIVQRQTSSERYVCLGQGQAKRPAQLVAMHWAHMVEVNNDIAEPRLGYSPGPVYGTAL